MEWSTNPYNEWQKTGSRNLCLNLENRVTRNKQTKQGTEEPLSKNKEQQKITPKGGKEKGWELIYSYEGKAMKINNKKHSNGGR